MHQSLKYLSIARDRDERLTVFMNLKQHYRKFLAPDAMGRSQKDDPGTCFQAVINGSE